ncbi:MAG: hypothetical protein Q7S77_00340 [Candidatus Staskawiczbacteria bacterium]|nr:hypothetical protein [Candidatus Staskawiczbacteria bacterium]
MTKRKYEWFLEPQDSHTNEVISKNVGDENFSIDIVCTDGQKRTFWQCPSGLVLMLWRSRSNLNIKLKIFGREGKNGKIRDVTFLFKYESGGTRNKRNRARGVIYGKL